MGRYAKLSRGAKTSIAALAVLSIPTIHVAGFGASSDYRLNDAFDAVTFSSIAATFSLHVILALLFARLWFLVLRGPVFRIAVMLISFFGPMKKIKRPLRILAVSLRRSALFSDVLTLVLASIIFCRLYLEINWISLLTVWAAIALGAATYLISEDSLVQVSRDLRGKHPLQYKYSGKLPLSQSRSSSEIKADEIIFREFKLSRVRQIMLAYLVFALVSYSFGGMRESALKIRTGWQIGDEKVLLPTSEGYIVWDEKNSTYSVIESGIPKLFVNK